MLHFFDDTADESHRRGPIQREKSLGSGVIVGSDGVILTNSHVVEHGDEIRVALQDGRELEAELVGADPASDIAVLRVNAKGLPAIPIADSSKIRIGDLVLAIGNPFGLGQTVTLGIISAVGRANMGILDYEDFIQTDAAINPGNSGGALVDMQGRLVGINTAIVSRTGGYQGVGFAIPSNLAVQVKTAILEHGKVTRGYLGVTLQNLTEDLARSLGISTNHGVVVTDVSPGSPAAAAGLERGDVIVAIDGTPVQTSAQLRTAIALAGKGARIQLQIERDRKRSLVNVTLGELQARAEAQKVEGGLLGGLTVQPLDPATRARLRVPDQIEGVVITELDPDSVAAGIGLREGDVIVEANRKPTPDVEAFREATRESTDRLLLLVYREGALLYVALRS